jgi:hypothetical protein
MQTVAMAETAARIRGEVSHRSAEKTVLTNRRIIFIRYPLQGKGKLSRAPDKFSGSSNTSVNARISNANRSDRTLRKKS